MKIAQFLCLAVLISGAGGCAQRAGLVVSHSPNPTDIHSAKIPEGTPYPHMWFYRTEVRNNTDRPIRISGFEGWLRKGSKWIPANILNRPLSSKDFAKWYGDGAPAPGGWIQPSASAVCDPNWHGGMSPVAPRCKWTYDGVDSSGKKYHAEAEIKSVAVKAR